MQAPIINNKNSFKIKFKSVVCWIKKCVAKTTFIAIASFNFMKKHTVIKIRRKIPNIYQDRIFFLSSFDEAEHLKDDLGQGKKETIGYQLAQHCYDNDSSLWKVPMLNHNLPEIEKLKIKFKFFS